MSHIHILKSKRFDGGWKSQYSDFVLRQPDSNIYHSLGWHRVIRDTYGFSPIYIFYKTSGIIKGTLTLFLVRSITGNRLVSIPYSHWVPILCSDEFGSGTLLSSADKVGRIHNCRFVMIRNGNRMPAGLGWTTFEDNYHTLLPLDSSLSAIWSNLESGARRAVKRARRDKVKVETVKTARAYRIFYQLMMDTRRRQCVPIYPIRFFDAIRKHLVPSGKARLLMAYQNGDALGGILVLYSGKSVVYGYGASLNDKNRMRSRPMDLLMWQAIEDSHRDHADFFDFGTTPRFHNSLLRFKEKWGASSRLLPYSCKHNYGAHCKPVKREGLLGSLGGRFLSRLPDKLYLSASELILKQLG